MRFLVAVWLLALCLALPALPAFAHISDGPPDPELAPVTSKHYRVVSEDGTNAARRASQALEVLRAEFVETFVGKLKLAGPEPVRYQPSYRKPANSLPPADSRLRVALVRGAGMAHAGLYDPRRGVAYVAIDKNKWPAGQLISTLRHEAAHQLFDKMLRIPVVAPRASAPDDIGSFWYREGLACYFEGSGRFRLNGTVRLMRLGTLEAVFRDRVLPSVSELVRITPDEGGHLPGVLGRGGSSVDYALAWSFVHFLLHGESGKHRDPFFAYLANLQQWNVHGRGGEAFSASFPDLEALHRGWVQHVVLLQRGKEADFERAFAPVGARPHRAPDKAAREFIPKLELDAPPLPPTADQMRARYATLAEIFAGPEVAWDERLCAEIFNDPAGLRELHAGFAKVGPATQKQVLDAIERTEERAALPMVLEISLRHADAATRKRAAGLVREFHYGLAPKAYFDLMRGQNSAAMQRVAEALEEVGDPHAIKYLVALLSQVGQRVGKAANRTGASVGEARPSENATTVGRFGNTTTVRPRTRRLEDQLPRTVLGRDEAEERMAYAVMRALRNLSGEDPGDSPKAWMGWLQQKFQRAR